MDHLLIKIVFFSYIANAVVFAGGCDGVDLSVDADVIADLALSVTCNADSIVVSIDTCVLERMGYDPASDLTINGDQDYETGTACATLPDTASGWEFTIDDPFTQCSTTATEEGTTIVYENHIQNIDFSNVGGPDIARRKKIKLPFSCTYERIFNEDGNSLVPVLTLNEADSSDNNGDFSPTVSLCEDSGCGTELSSGASVDLLTDVFIVVETDLALDILFLNVIAASTSTLGSGGVEYDLLKDECIPAAEEDYVVRPDSGSGNNNLQFSMFHWTAGDVDDPIYLFIEFELCDSTFQSCAYDACTARRKRSPRLNANGNAPTIYRTTLGPFKANLV